MIFCCSSQSLADRIVSDPKAAAKYFFDRFDNAADPASESVNFSEELMTICKPEWAVVHFPKFLIFISELGILLGSSEKEEMKVLSEGFALVSESLKKALKTHNISLV